MRGTDEWDVRGEGKESMAEKEEVEERERRAPEKRIRAEGRELRRRIDG